MDTQQVREPRDPILERIDAIILELQALRQAVRDDRRPGQGDLTSKLYGVLGQGTWEEYDPDLDWKRFADE